MPGRWVRGLALLVAGMLIGGGLLAITPANASLKTSINTLWSQLKPKADKRYVKKTDRSKLVRTAATSSSLSGAALTSNSVTVLSTDIKAPSKGFLVVNVHGGFYTASGAPLVHCGLAVDGDFSTWTAEWGISMLSTVSGAGFSPCSLAIRVPVAAGLHTLDYQAHNDGGGTVNFAGGSMTATFVPYGANGKQGTPKPITSDGGDIARQPS